MAIRHLEQETAQFAAVFGHSIRPLALDTAAIVAAGDRILIPRYRASAARYGFNVTDDIRRQLALGMVRGETFFELTERMSRMGGPRGVVSLRGVAGELGAVIEHIPEGLFRRYRYWGERVVRTEGIHALNVNQLEGLRDMEHEDPGYLKRWDSTGDSRLCVQCRDLDGDVRPINEQFPGGILVPPAHPGCRCSLTPWRAEWASDKWVTSTVAHETESAA
jgi:hypothetical protein